MKNRKRLITLFCAVMLCMMAFPLTAYAGGLEEPTPEPPIVEVSPEVTPVTGGYDPDVPDEPTPEPRPFIPSGTGTVIDNATDADGKEFYTIMTPDENVFYLVIDRQRSTENVYFLNAVTEADLMALAEIPETPVPTPITEPTPAPEIETPETPSVPEKSGSNMGMMIFIIAVVLIGGGAGWYFKLYKPKQQKAETEDDYDYSADDYDDDSDDDGLPPWDDEDSEDDTE